MIRPSYRLIQFGFLVCLFMLIGFAYSNSFISLILPVIGFVLIAAIDLYNSMHIGYKFSLEIPSDVRGLSGKSFVVELLISNDLGRDYSIKVISKNVPWAQEVVEQNYFNAPRGKSKINIAGKFGLRGKYSKGIFGLLYFSPFYLWEYVKEFSLESTEKAVVYPSYLDSRKKLVMQLHALQLTGNRRHRQIGKGKDFERLREYMPGDSYSDICWKATAKRNFPISKVYQIEKTQELYLAIDCSRLSNKVYLDEDNKPKVLIDKFLEVAFLLGECCIKNGDKFGLIIFSDCIQHFVKAKSGNDQLRYCKEVLYNLRSSENAPDYNEVVAEIFEKVSKRSLIVFLLNLEDIVESENFISSINFITRKHLVYAQMLKTPDVDQLFKNEIATSSEISSILCKHMRWAHIMDVRQKLKLKGVEFSLSESSAYTANAINHYMLIKLRQSI